MLGHLPLGVMQGRLLPKYKGRYQAHPVGYWEDEFRVAAGLGLELIEFILDFEDAGKNPLLADPEAIRRASGETGVSVRSVCADYFMEAPVQSGPESVRVLQGLIENASALGVRDIVIPCVDGASLKGRSGAAAFVEALRPVLPLAGRRGVNLALETDLAPGDFKWLLSEFGSAAVTVNYDTGNSASLGYDPAEELAAYGDRISDIHIKDRVLGGGSVELGAGDTRFDAVLRFISGGGYKGPLIMQAYRDDEGIEIFRRQLSWFQSQYNAFVERGR